MVYVYLKKDDAFEILQVLHVLHRIDRTCLRDSQLGGLRVRKGTLVQVPIWAIQNHPDFYPEPERFDPTRFLAGSEVGVGGSSRTGGGDFTYLAFGGGPRLCVGMRWVGGALLPSPPDLLHFDNSFIRFAMVEMKISLAKFISTFKVVATPETKLESTKGDMFFFSYPEVKVKLERRN